MKFASQINLSFLARTPVSYWIGWIHYKRGRWAGADRKFAAAIRANPRHAPSYFQRGMVEFKRERWENAYSYMSEALALEPTRTDWMVQFCQTARHLKGTQAKALDHCTSHILQRISEDQTSAELHSELAAIYRIQGRAWLEHESLKNAIALKSQDASLFFRLGEVSERMTRHEEAAECFQRAAELNPGDAMACYKAGFMLETTDNPAASNYYAQAIADDPTVEGSRFGIGAFHAAAGHWQAATNAYSRQLVHRPDDAELHFRLGSSHDRQQAWRDAIRHYRDAIAIDPTQPEWFRRLGTLQEKLGDHEAAAASYGQLLRFPQFANHSVWLYRHAYTLDLAGKSEAACIAYDAVAAGNDPSLSGAIVSGLKGLGRALKSSPTGGRGKSRSVAEISTRLEKNATSAGDWFDLGTALESNGDQSGAANAYRQATARSNDHQPRYYDRLGRALAAIGQHRQACEAYRNLRILQRNPNVAEDHFRRHAKFRRTASYVEYSEVLPLRGKSILYESFHGRMLSCNPFAIFLHLLNHPDYADWAHIWSIEDMKVVPDRFKSLPNVIFVTRDSDACLRHLATAAILVNNVTFPSFFTRRDGQIYLNTWHGTPWKTLGRDAKGEFMSHGNVARNLLQASHIASPNRHTSEVLLDAFNVDGIFNGALMEAGSPRVDLTLQASNAEKSALRARLGVPDGRKVVLYAPTWRGTLESPYHEVAATQNVIRQLCSTDCHLLFRGHYFVESALDGNADAKLLPPADISTNELLAITDVLVTDYSSVFFDFLSTGRPVIFHLEDHAAYLADRGLYFDASELPGPVANDPTTLASQVAEALRDAPPHPEYARFRERYCHLDDGNACQRVMDFILGKTTPPTARRDNKRNLLIFGGHFALNGITIALVNLLKNIDHDRLRVFVIVEMAGIALVPESLEYLKSLPPEIRVLPRAGSANTTLEERRVIGEFNRRYALEDDSPTFNQLRHHFRREERRMFGSACFDAGIDYSGYTSYYASLFGFADRAAIGYKAIYQHNEMFGEWSVKYPELERVFHLYRQFDHLISVSPGARNLNRDQLADRFKVPAERFDYVENPVDHSSVLSRAAEPMDPRDEAEFFVPGTIVFVTIGRLSVEKDHRKLIQSFALLHADRPEARLLILGDGPLAVMLELLVGELGLRGIVHLAGYRFNPFPYLKRADCFVFSSNHEGQGLVLLEAMMLARPIVCADIEVCRGVVEHRSGLLVENSVDGLYQGMLEYLAGHIAVCEVDFVKYQQTALEMFYQKSCGFNPSTLPANETHL